MKPILPVLKLLIVALCLFSLNFNPQQGLSVGQSAYAATYVAPTRQAVVTHIPKLARLNAFELAIRALVGVSVETVSWVMDEKNTQVRYKIPVESANNAQAETYCKQLAKKEGWNYGYLRENKGKDYIYWDCMNPYMNQFGSYYPKLEGVLTFNQIADQMIANAVTGNKDSQNALDIVKRAMAQANAPKPPLKPSVVVTQPKPTPVNPPKDETKPDTKPKPDKKPKASPQQRQEQAEYNKVCKTKPPTTGNKCEDARVNLARLKQCSALRKAFSKKWYNDQDRGHMIEIENTDRAVKRLENFLDENCKK